MFQNVKHQYPSLGRLPVDWSSETFKQSSVGGRDSGKGTGHVFGSVPRPSPARDVRSSSGSGNNSLSNFLAPSKSPALMSRVTFGSVEACVVVGRSANNSTIEATAAATMSFGRLPRRAREPARASGNTKSVKSQGKQGIVVGFAPRYFAFADISQNTHISATNGGAKRSGEPHGEN